MRQQPVLLDALIQALIIVYRVHSQLMRMLNRFISVAPPPHRCFPTHAQSQMETQMDRIQELANAGYEFLNSGSYADALSHFLAALANYDALDGEERERCCLYANFNLHVSTCYLKLNDSAACGLAARAEDHDYPAVLAAHASSCTNAGLALAAMSRITEAVAFFQEALPLYESSGDEYRIANCLVNLAIQYQTTGQHELGLQILQRASQLLSSTPQLAAHSAEAMLGITNSRAVHFRALDRQEEAAACFQPAVAQSELLYGALSAQTAFALVAIANFLLKSDPNAALEYALRASATTAACGLADTAGDAEAALKIGGAL